MHSFHLCLLVCLGAVMGCGVDGAAGSYEDVSEVSRAASEPLLVGSGKWSDAYAGAATYGSMQQLFLGESTGVLLAKTLIGSDNVLKTTNLSLCSGEEFSGSPCLKKATSGVGCSAALVTNQHVLTAKHCQFDLNNNRVALSDLRLALGWVVRAPWSDPHVYVTLTNDQIYTPTSVFWESPDRDVVILTLDRSVSFRYRPFTVGSSPSNGDMVYTLGYPHAMPLKFSLPGDVWGRDGDFFRAAINGMQGHSGSPVLSASTHKIVGVFQGGPALDMEYDSAAQCNRWVVDPAGGIVAHGAGNFAQKVNEARTAAGATQTCAGACNGRSPDGCWCDPACVGYGDCCPDASSCSPYWNRSDSSTCANACGGGTSTCWCDLQCSAWGDCCEDFFSTCGRW
ncbi:MAG: trypsin-like peptidase domain-containing protein [Polyangiaceae bacterium]|nr:trypsin-like peptidase domain-containing protein [Polyangiaceae bacterium]